MPGIVVVGVHGSLTSLAALRTAVDEARARDAALVAVLAWVPVGGEVAYRRAPCSPLLNFWRAQAHDRLVTAFDEALGGMPDDIAVTLEVVRANPGQVLVEAARSDCDLLVVGVGHRRIRRRRLLGPTARYCASRAACPVVLVPPPELLGADGRVPRHVVADNSAPPELVNPLSWARLMVKAIRTLRRHT